MHYAFSSYFVDILRGYPTLFSRNPMNISYLRQNLVLSRQIVFLGYGAVGEIFLVVLSFLKEFVLFGFALEPMHIANLSDDYLYD